MIFEDFEFLYFFSLPLIIKEIDSKENKETPIRSPLGAKSQYLRSVDLLPIA